MKTSDIEKIVYFQDYVVTDPGQDAAQEEAAPHRRRIPRRVRKVFGDEFEAEMGAEAIKKLLGGLDLNFEQQKVREDIDKTNSKQKIKDLTKRLKMIEAIRNSENKSEWMVMDVIPVIPPDLRPLVLLESGNFATSDLNDLYRRIINRNNRLKKLVDLNAPEVIIRNEKRMLQQAVDALFDNGRCRRPVLGSANRPLKSLTDMIKGKQGRFRENLLGKRVDYSRAIASSSSARNSSCTSAACPRRSRWSSTSRSSSASSRSTAWPTRSSRAKKMLERRDPEVWDILEECIYQHPVMLNRAPTLHRMGIQAFEPVLVEGNAIKIHPLVCKGFNADFDGDQMAVHLPLSIEAQAEAHVLMLAPNNIFSPANGSPIISPVAGHRAGHVLHHVRARRRQGRVQAVQQRRPKRSWLTSWARSRCTRASSFACPIARRSFPTTRAALCRSRRLPRSISTSTASRLDPNYVPKEEPAPEEARSRKKPSHVILTTVGRCIFNDILPRKMPFYNYALTAKGAVRVIADTYAELGRPATIDLLDDMKELGFRRSTLAGLSFGITDIRSPDSKPTILDEGRRRPTRSRRTTASARSPIRSATTS